MVISSTGSSDPTQMHSLAARLRTEGNSPSPPAGGPSPSDLTTESSGSQSQQLSCNAPPLRAEKHYGGPEELQGRKPITAEGSPHPARLRGGVIGQDRQPKQPIEL